MYVKPPPGWFTFGYHASMDPIPELEFSDRTDDEGFPLWERPAN